MFGVYPFGISAGPDGLIVGPPDDLSRVGAALSELSGGGPPLLVRTYVVFEGSVERALAQVAQFAAIGPLVDLSLNFHDARGDVDAWCEFVDRVVQAYGSTVGSIGITNEANLLDVPVAPDGAYPNSLDALVEGLRVADLARRHTGSTATLGFTAASSTTPSAQSFWRRLSRHRGDVFSPDFAGLTLYPDGFGSAPASLAAVADRTRVALVGYREQLSVVGLPRTLPIRVSESGWPTGPGRTEEQQADVLATIIDTVVDLRADLNISHLELFALRDADSTCADVFGHFGVLRDDYTPKPAYAVLRTKISALNSR